VVVAERQCWGRWSLGTVSPQTSWREGVPMHCLQHKGERPREPEGYATRGPNASPNRGTNCRRYVCIVLRNVL
jgi:hypothetical protein